MAIDNAHIQMALTIDDLELRRTHAVRTMVDSRDLLADALDAIRAGDTHVADEFVDRALTAITAELTHQRGA